MDTPTVYISNSTRCHVLGQRISVLQKTKVEHQVLASQQKSELNRSRLYTGNLQYNIIHEDANKQQRADLLYSFLTHPLTIRAIPASLIELDYYQIKWSNACD